MKKLIVLFFVFYSILNVQSQQIANKDLGAWYMYFGKIQLSDQFSIHNETQWRQRQLTSDLEQSLTRIGLNYHIDKENMITAGYGYILNRQLVFQFFEMDYEFNKEHRIWQQYVQKHRLKRMYFDHRFRLEQRFVYTSNNSNSNFSNRARYRIGLAIPLSKKELSDKTLFFYWYDEVFLNISDTPFSQNRFYTALGYKFGSKLSVQAGYLWWYTNQLNNRLQLGIFYNIDFRKSEEN